MGNSDSAYLGFFKSGYMISRAPVGAWEGLGKIGRIRCLAVNGWGHSGGSLIATAIFFYR